MGHDLPDRLPETVLNTFNYYMDNERLRIEVGESRLSGMAGVWCDPAGSCRPRCWWPRGGSSHAMQVVYFLHVAVFQHSMYLVRSVYWGCAARSFGGVFQA